MLNSTNKRTPALAIGALGIVYGDLGTSPLYALQQVLPKVSINEQNILGVLSLVFWSLILVITARYVTIFLQANNDGEGGIFALLSLLKRGYQKLPRWIYLLGIFGAGLLLGDGMITPAISVISAIEGLRVISPQFSYLITPISFAILLILFACQRFGTGRIGNSFGPIILAWFITIGTLGALAIANNPTVLKALNPYHAYLFFYIGGWKAYILLSGIFLVVTGAEAMYTDLGQFGKAAIRISWLALALPALVLNYFGQGAYLLQHPEAIANVFYMLAPSWFYFPLLILATLATIIASQAIISASFSLTNQAILLNVFPRLKIIHTSKEEKGQVYVPQVNLLLAIGTLLLVLLFQTSEALAGAYGIAVNLVMIIVAILVSTVARKVWKWPLYKVLLLFSPFLMIDFAFFGANFHKIFHGGWIPLLFAAVSGLVMLTWHRGIEFVRSSFYLKKRALPEMITNIHKLPLNAVKDLTAIFISDLYDQCGGSLLHYFELNKIMPEKVLMVNVVTENYPNILEKNRFELKTLAKNIHQLTVHYGYMQKIDVPKVLMLAEKMKLFPYALDVNKAYFLVEILKVAQVKNKRPFWLYGQKKLFTYLLRNSEVDIEFFHLPYERTIAIGNYCEI